MRWSSLLIFVSACAGTGIQSPPSATEHTPRKVTVASVRAERAHYALELSGGAAGRLGEDLRAGRSWLNLDAPRAFSFASAALLAGETAWTVKRQTTVFARERGGKAGGTALTRIEGRASSDPITEISKPSHPSVGLGTIPTQSVRVLLGRGVDQLLDRGETEAIIWIDVVDASGQPVPWQSKLGDAYRQQSLAPVQELLVEVERNSINDRTYYRVPLELVLLAAQSKLTRNGEVTTFVWEGVWRGAMVNTAPSYANVTWNAPARLEYKEYAKPRKSFSLLRTVFAPVALASDFGAAFLDPEADQGLFEETRDRQKSRR